MHSILESRENMIRERIECSVEDLVALVNEMPGEFVIDVEIKEEGEKNCG